MDNDLNQHIDTIYNLQKEYNLSTRSLEYRKKQIQKITTWIESNESRIKTAIKNDLKKPDVEIDITEIWVCLKEAKYILKNLKKWMRKKRIPKTLSLITTTSYIAKEPKGIVLIISPWNYPFQLAIMPLLCAIAAGNSVFLKPSEKTPNTSNLIKSMIDEIFDPKNVVAYEGDEKVVTSLMEKSFDHVFFTGGTHIGQIIMEKASKNLTPVTLELGGKCPVLIDSSANLKDAADKISSIKFMNSGQTCVAPDFVLIDQAIKDQFIDIFKESVENQYGNIDSIHQNKDYGRIVNKDHSSRLDTLLRQSIDSGSKLVLGGKSDVDDLFISPTIIETDFDDALMKEEIFGPILPIIKYNNYNDALLKLSSFESPLASYIFSNKSNQIKQFIQSTKSGAVCINDLSIHLIHDKLPFGGVGKSGIGCYHGKFGFDELSNSRPVIKNISRSPLKLIYPPYTKKVKKMLKWLKKLI